MKATIRRFSLLSWFWSCSRWSCWLRNGCIIVSSASGTHATKIYCGITPNFKITHKDHYIHTHSPTKSAGNSLGQLRQQNDKLDIERYPCFVPGRTQLHGIRKRVAGIAYSGDGIWGEIVVESRQFVDIIERIGIETESLFPSIINRD